MGEVRKVNFGGNTESAQALEVRREEEKNDALRLVRPILDLLRKKFIIELQTTGDSPSPAAYASLPPCLQEACRSGRIFQDVDRWELQFRYIGELLGKKFARWELDIVYNPEVTTEIPKPIKEIIAHNFEPKFVAVQIKAADEGNIFLKRIKDYVESGKIFEVRLGSLGITAEDLL